MSSASGSDPKLPEPPIEPRIPGEGIFPVRDVLPGLEQREVFKDVCAGFDAAVLLEAAHILCFKGEGYPRVDDHTGHILCPDTYTKTHDPLIIYLDIFHELVHVRQVLEGKAVYHFPKPYVDWPTEIEAYRITYDEARRLGVDDDWFWRYLAVPWVEHEDLVRLARSIGMKRITGETPVEAAPEDDEGARL